MIARIHATASASRANGPGRRFVVWFQGCTLGCAGCFNPATHAAAGPTLELDDDGAIWVGDESVSPTALVAFLAAARREAASDTLRVPPITK